MADAEKQNWNQLKEQMPTVKITIIDLLLDAIRYRLDNFFDIVQHYDRVFRYRRLAFSSYSGRQQGIQEICRRLTFGSQKYGQQPSPRRGHVVNFEPRTRDRWTFEPALDHAYEDEYHHHHIIAFGNGNFGNMRGKRPEPSKKISNIYALYFDIEIEIFPL